MCKVKVVIGYMNCKCGNESGVSLNKRVKIQYLEGFRFMFSEKKQMC